MNYIFNIKINLHKNYYEYYEWLPSDKIDNIKKIPLIRVSDKDFINLRVNKVRINDYNGLLALTNTRSIYIINIDNNIVIEYSSINISDELDILPITNKLNVTKLEYEIICRNSNSLLSRQEYKLNNYILNKIKKLDTDKIKYLYLECYNKQLESPNTMKNKIVYDIKHNNILVIKKIYNILKLVSIK